MKMTIIGAAGGEATGSAYVVQTNPARGLVDCGRFQGGKRAESLIAPSKPRTVLTHGENEPRRILSKFIQQRYKIKPLLRDLNESVA